MVVRGTTREAYKKLTDLGKRQREVFDILKRIEPATDRDISKHTDIDIRSINARRGELQKYGYVVEHGKRLDPSTHRNAITWVTTDPMADRQVQKATGKPEHTEEKKSVNKFSLKLKDGKMYTISEAMKNEIEQAMAVQRGAGGKITLAGHEFWLANIVIPIREQETEEALEPIKNEATRTEVYIEAQGAWQIATESEMKMRRDRVSFRTRRIGVDSGRVVYDMLTFYEDGYESLRDMKGKAL